jgi:hypothetical protein
MMRKTNFLSIVIFLIFIASTSEIYANSANSDEYIILNLHWSEGEITLNSLNKVTGLIKRTGRRSSVQSFFYMLLTENGEKIKSDYFRVPRKLHYDYFDESTGELKGGQVKRDDFDFVIKVPSYYDAKEIKFYKVAGKLAANNLNAKQGFGKANNSDYLGKIDF